MRIEFSFLQNRNNYDVVVLVEEVFHSVKSSNLKFNILKLDLSKAYNILVGLSYMGFALHMVNWIMGCLQSTYFVVLINGALSDFFQSSDGIFQGFPLSSLPFHIVVKDFNKLVNNYQFRGDLQGVKVFKVVVVSHILFVDDSLYCIMGGRRKFSSLKCYLDLFRKAIEMEINSHK